MYLTNNKYKTLASRSYFLNSDKRLEMIDLVSIDMLMEAKRMNNLKLLFFVLFIIAGNLHKTP